MDESSSGGRAPEAALPAPLTVWTSYLLRQATLRAQERVAAALAELALRPPHNSVLSLLGAAPHSQVTLAAQLQTDRTTMVAIIDDLERLGLVERRRNPQDRRAHDVTLTDQGAQMLAQAQALVGAADAAFFAPLSEAERAQLRGMLLRLIATHDRAPAGS